MYGVKMTSKQDRSKRIRQYPVICLLITLVIGFPQRAFTATDKYKSAVPVIDYIEKERPQGSVTREIKALQEPSLIYRFTLSQEFLAALLSFLMLFLSTYIYFRYIKPAARMSKGEHRHRHKTTPLKPESRTDDRAMPSEESQEKIEESVKDEESSTEQKPEGAGIEVHTEEPEKTPQPVNLLQFKAERDQHAQRIYHLLDKL